MKQVFKILMIFVIGTYFSTAVIAQANASLNLATLQSGDIYINGAGLLNIAVNNTGPSASIATGKLRVQISAPTTLSIPTGQTITGWTIDYLNAQTVNLCNSATVIPVGGVANIQLALLGGPVGSTGQSIGGQISFRTNCTAPGSLAGDNPADNSATAGFNLVNAPLPITLTDFNASLMNCVPILKWQTSSEINSSHFEIERASANSVSWTKIGTLLAGGNTSNKLHYSFTDNTLNSTTKVLYRLKMIDLDGKFKYSEILRVSANCKTFQIDVYPNPAQKGRLYISLTGGGSLAEATLSGLSGQIISKSKITNGTNYLNVANVANGIYILNVINEQGDTKKVKILIQN